MPTKDQIRVIFDALEGADKDVDALFSLALAAVTEAPGDDGLARLYQLSCEKEALRRCASGLYTPERVYRIATVHPQIARSRGVAAHPARTQILLHLAAEAEAKPGKLAEHVFLAALSDPPLTDIAARMVVSRGTLLLLDDLGAGLPAVLNRIGEWFLGEVGDEEIGATTPFRSDMTMWDTLIQRAHDRGLVELVARLADTEVGLDALLGRPWLVDEKLCAHPQAHDLPERLMRRAMDKKNFRAARKLATDAGEALRGRLLDEVPWRAPSRADTDAGELARYAMANLARRLGASPVHAATFCGLADSWGGTYGGLVDAVLDLS